jgi:hypothetical protein
VSLCSYLTHAAYPSPRSGSAIFKKKIFASLCI